MQLWRNNKILTILFLLCEWCPVCWEYLLLLMYFSFFFLLLRFMIGCCERGSLIYFVLPIGKFIVLCTCSIIINYFNSSALYLHWLVRAFEGISCRTRTERWLGANPRYTTFTPSSSSHRKFGGWSYFSQMVSKNLHNIWSLTSISIVLIRSATVRSIVRRYATTSFSAVSAK